MIHNTRSVTAAPSLKSSHLCSTTPLKIECARQRLPPAGPATRLLTHLDVPSIDWVSLAKGMGVQATRVTTCEELRGALESAIAGRFGAKAVDGQVDAQRVESSTTQSNGNHAPGGPFLIQACLP